MSQANWWSTASAFDIRHALWERYRLPEDAADAIKERLSRGEWDADARKRLEQEVRELVARLPHVEEQPLPSCKSEWE